MNADFFLALAYGVLDEAQRAGVQVVHVLSAGGYGKVAEQVAQLEELNTLKLDAVILVSTAFDGFDKVVDRLVTNGTKVIMVGTPISSPKVSLAVMQNEPGVGKMEADFICKQKPGATVITLPGWAVTGGETWTEAGPCAYCRHEITCRSCGGPLVGGVSWLAADRLHLIRSPVQTAARSIN
jgi:ABC-type sugar transport system substrate-binding protein